jgi:hypothetical protein
VSVRVFQAYLTRFESSAQPTGAARTQGTALTAHKALHCGPHQVGCGSRRARRLSGAEQDGHEGHERHKGARDEAIIQACRLCTDGTCVLIWANDKHLPRDGLFLGLLSELVDLDVALGHVEEQPLGHLL